MLQHDELPPAGSLVCQTENVAAAAAGRSSLAAGAHQAPARAQARRHEADLRHLLGRTNIPVAGWWVFRLDWTRRAEFRCTAIAIASHFGNEKSRLIEDDSRQLESRAEVVFVVVVVVENTEGPL